MFSYAKLTYMKLLQTCSTGLNGRSHVSLNHVSGNLAQDSEDIRQHIMLRFLLIIAQGLFCLTWNMRCLSKFPQGGSCKNLLEICNKLSLSFLQSFPT